MLRCWKWSKIDTCMVKCCVNVSKNVDWLVCYSGFLISLHKFGICHNNCSCQAERQSSMDLLLMISRKFQIYHCTHGDSLGIKEHLCNLQVLLLTFVVKQINKVLGRIRVLRLASWPVSTDSHNIPFTLHSSKYLNMDWSLQQWNLSSIVITYCP